MNKFKRLMDPTICRKCEHVVLGGSATYCANSGTPGPTWTGFMETKPPPPKCPYVFERAVYGGTVNIDKIGNDHD